MASSRSFREAEIRYDSVMRSIIRFLLSTAMLATLGGAAAVAMAQSGRDEPPPEMPQRPEAPPSRQNQASSLSDAVRRVQRETGGQVLGAERIQFDGRDINRVKVMDDRGRVRYVDGDPQRERRREPSPPRESSPQPRPRGDNPSRP